MNFKSAQMTVARMAGVSLLFATTTFSVMASAQRPAEKPAKPADDEYPLKTCIVSDEPLPTTGEFVAYTHTLPDKTEVTLRLCCEGCIEDFRQDPPKFLKKLDAAKKKQTKPRKG